MFVLLGGNGYVGTAFQKCLTGRGIPYISVSRSEVDYSDELTLRDWLGTTGATFLINTAGFTGRPNVDACELQKAHCLAGNAVLPGTIRTVCEELKLPWGHVSSGCIYTGEKADGTGFDEQDPPNFSFRQNNCSFYSGTKALGEEILAGAERCYVWRLRIPFDEYDSPRNYISKMMRYDCLLDARNSLSHLRHFVESCVACHTTEIEYGVYNLTNPGSVTTRDVVELIKRHKLTDRSFSFFESLEQFMEQAASAPRSNCVLDSQKAIAAGLPLLPIEESLEQAMSNWVPA